jgi:hypothetical protein
MSEPAVRTANRAWGELAHGELVPGPSPADRLVRVGSVFALVAVLVQSAIHLTNVFLFEAKWQRLDADAEFGVFSWASSSATFAAAFAAAVLAVITRPGLRGWVLVAIGAGYSLDDALAFHEQLGGYLAGAFSLPSDALRLLWVAALSPALAAACLLIWALARESEGRVRHVLTIGLAALAAAVVAELVGAGLLAFGWSHERIAHKLETAFEEGAELGGWILIASGLMAKAVAALTRGPARSVA